MNKINSSITIKSCLFARYYDIAIGTSNLEAIRWLRRVSKYISRVTEHFEQAVLASGKPLKEGTIKASI